MKLLPFFEVNAKKYELKPTRYLIAEYDKMARESQLSEEEKQNALIIKAETEKFQEIAERYNKAEQEFFDDVLNESKEIVYEKLRVVYEKARERYYSLIVSDRSVEKMQRAATEMNERILIMALSEQYELSEAEAKKVWESYVEQVGVNSATEWLAYMAKYLFQEREEETNPFLERARAKEAERVNRQRGYAKK